MLRSNIQQADPALVYIFPKDVLHILTHIKSYNGAWLHYRKIKQSLCKQKHQRITLQEFCEWEGLDVSIVQQRLAS